MKKIIGVILILASIYCFYVGFFELWNLSTKKMDNGLGEYISWISGVFGFVLGTIFILIGYFLLKKSLKIENKND